MADAGCQCVYVVDSAGALLPDGVRDRVQALVAELGDDAQVGFHGHQNLSLGVANSIVAYENGRPADRRHAVRAGRRRRQLADRDPGHRVRADGRADRVSTSTRVLAAAEEVLKPMITRLPVADRASIVQGRFGVYNSFLLHAERAADRYGVSAHEILRRVGEAGYVGGQEDMIIDVAIDLAREQQAGGTAGRSPIARRDMPQERRLEPQWRTIKQDRTNTWCDCSCRSVEGEIRPRSSVARSSVAHNTGCASGT